MSRRGGYRIWAAGDRCEADWDLRAARRATARAIAQQCSPATVAACRLTEARAVEDVAMWEARYQLARVGN